ncbi:MAG: hypothetical protein J2P52_08825 [Blastocatellia bacterium]|nr:hypothetical protein [Blastocatellia bacterium]
MPFKPAKSLAIKLGDSGIAKPKFEVWAIGLVGADAATGLVWAGLGWACLGWTGMFWTCLF